tara:strand:- start:149 stop:415 length:267 start_codon:yes stop_codon:yes gene_type:complete
MVLKQSVVVLVGTARLVELVDVEVELIIITHRIINQSRDLQVKQHFIQDLLHKDFLAVTVTSLVMAAVVEPEEQDKMRCLESPDHMAA